jgi:hypothetical protein
VSDKLIFRAGKPEVGDYVATGFTGLAVGSFLAAATNSPRPGRWMLGSLAASLVLQAVVGVPERKKGTNT